MSEEDHTSNDEPLTPGKFKKTMYFFILFYELGLIRQNGACLGFHYGFTDFALPRVLGTKLTHLWKRRQRGSMSTR